MLLEKFKLSAIATAFGVVGYGCVVGESPVWRVGGKGGEVDEVGGGEPRDRRARGWINGEQGLMELWSMEERTTCRVTFCYDLSCSESRSSRCYYKLIKKHD